MRIGIIGAGRAGKTLGDAGQDIADVAKARVDGMSRVRGPRGVGLLLRRRAA